MIMTDFNPYLKPQHIERLLQTVYGNEAHVLELTPYEIDNSASILVTLTSQQSQSLIGHFGIEVLWSFEGQERLDRLVLKVKPHGKEIAEMLAGLAALSDAELGENYAPHKISTGFANTHLREPEVYNQLRHPIQPRIYGYVLDEASDQYQVLIEDLSGCTHLNSVMAVSAWKDEQIVRALSDLSDWHAYARDKNERLNPLAWQDTNGAQYWLKEAGLWRLLLEKAADRFPGYYAKGLRESLEEGLDNIEVLAAKLADMPKTLIHNDANPRNACFREDGSFCLYDWELSCWQAPVYDVIELLSFVLEEDRYSRIGFFLSVYRDALQQKWQIWKDDRLWEESLSLAWYAFGWHRLGMYMMAHAVAPYEFLPRVFNAYSALGSHLGLLKK